MRRLIFALFLLPLTIPALYAAEPEEKPPVVPPRLLPAPDLKDKGVLIFHQVRLEYREEVRTRTVIVGTEKKTITEKFIVPVYIESLGEFEAKEYEAFDLEGKKIEQKDLGAALKKHPLIVLAADGKKIDAAYLKMFREGTVVLVPTPQALAKLSSSNAPQPPPPPKER